MTAHPYWWSKQGYLMISTILLINKFFQTYRIILLIENRHEKQILGIIDPTYSSHFKLNQKSVLITIHIVVKTV